MSEKRKLTKEEVELRQFKKQNKTLNNKIIMIRAVFIVSLILLICRVAYIKIVHGEEYEKVAVSQQTTRVIDTIKYPKRGSILDTNGQIMAISKTVYTVIIDVENSYDDSVSIEERENIISTLAEILEVPREDIAKYYEIDPATKLPVYNTKYKVIAKDISYEQGKAIKDSNIRCVYLEEGSKREYPLNNVASQVIGFLRGDSVDNYWGIENSYNEYMLGETGRTFRTYSDNNEIITNDILAVTGDTVVTTIDVNMQNFAEKIVYKYGEMYNAQNTSTIVMNPNSGEIYAMAQYPTFNNNAPGLLSDITRTGFESFYEATPDENKYDMLYGVWKNFNTQEAFEPGSTYKVSVAAAALEEGVITDKTQFYCPGYKIVGGYTIKCHKIDGHGYQNITQVLANSCNVAMMDLAEMMGKDLYSQYQREFGFGDISGIDLPGEESVSKWVYDVSQLNEVELATGGMGQGFSATPIQSLMAFNATINGGNLLTPYVVSEVIGVDGQLKYKNYPNIRRKVISQETSDFLRIALKEVVSERGTGYKAIIDGYSVAGKTGTAEQGVRVSGEETLSFISYFPAENPEYMVMSIVHKPVITSNKGGTASYMTKEMIEKIIEYKGIQPTQENNAVSKIKENKVSVPDFVGQNIVEVTKQLNAQGLSYEIIGSGNNVYKQMPQANSIATIGGIVYIYVDNQSEEELVVVPNVIGLAENVAVQMLKDVGFEVKVECIDYEPNANIQPEDEGVEIVDSEEASQVATLEQKIVSKQMPSPTIQLPKGTEIKIIVK